MDQTVQVQIARYNNLVLTQQGVRYLSDEDGERVNAFIPTHAIAGYEETSCQKLGLLIWALGIFCLAVAMKNAGFGYLNRDNLHGITQIFQYPREILDYLHMLGPLVIFYLVYRFFKTRSHAIRIYSTSGFSVVEMSKLFIFRPKPTDFLAKLEVEILARKR